jgi:hypothetical protein
MPYISIQYVALLLGSRVIPAEVNTQEKAKSKLALEAGLAGLRQ